ncbi:hypothetical protein BDV93DRAFT_298326, partial [Ceratobasidium sp. AG-I]
MTTDVTTLCSQWSTARKQLTFAIDAFESACNAFGALGVQAGAALESTQPDFLLSVEGDRPLLTHEKNCIVDSLATLKKLRNGSTRLVSLNQLPSEILASIFSIVISTSRTDWYHQQSTKLEEDFTNTISSVSSYWHHVCLNTPALWAQTRLCGQHWRKRVALWLERSRSCSLSLSAEMNTGTEGDLDRQFEAHTTQFKSLVFSSGTGYNIGEKIFHAACAQYTEASVKLEFLAITTYNGERKSPRMLELPPKDQMDRYLKSVRTLYVRFRLFDDWTSTVFQNLTTLSLQWLRAPHFPTYENLLGVLRASPGLRTLEIIGSCSIPAPQNDPPSVPMNGLKFLRLEKVSSQFTRWLLKATVPQEDRLALTLVDVWETPSLVSLGFDLPSPRSDRTTALYIVSRASARCNLDLFGLLQTLPRLETLACCGLIFLNMNSTAHPDNTHDLAFTTLDLDRC